MEWISFAISFLVLFFLLGTTLLIIWSIHRHKDAMLPFQYTRKAPKIPYFTKVIEQTIPFQASNLNLDAQSQTWRDAMQAVGQRLDDYRVSNIYFVHGTFAGDDPFGIVPSLQRIFPNMNEVITESIRQRIKRRFDHSRRDTANYISEYAELFQAAANCNAKCQLFVWASGNHHASRLRGSLSLMRRLYEDLPDLPTNRVLLFGHSHASQVFALLSHLIDESPLGEQMWALLKEASWADESDLKRIKKLRKFNFDIVTFGAPLRYPWQLSKNIRLVHIINHRGPSHLACHPFGFWKTQGGDYIQQWGIHGSDYLATTAFERELNRKLDRLLGMGIDPKGWIDCVTKGMRVSEFGITYLVDYKDASLFVPNALTTMFGHGAYTKFDHMLFNAQLCCDALYPLKSPNFRSLMNEKGVLIDKSENFRRNKK